MAAVEHVYALGPSSTDRTGAGELLDLLLRRPAWHAAAACHGHPEIDWFPEGTGRGDDARAVCATCLARRDCGAWALEQDRRTLLGVWAGSTSRQRHRATTVDELLALVDAADARRAAKAPDDCCTVCGRDDRRLVSGRCDACRRRFYRAAARERELAAAG